MGLSYTETRYSINGLIATEDTVLNNLEKLTNAAGAWLTYDIHAGKWSVIINKSGTSQHSFNDSNIIGPISVNGTGLDNLYNKVTVTFPHEDLRDQKDVLSIEIPAEDRNANEPDNTLNITYDIVTNPVQAELLGFIELKQSRVDKIITFRTDYSKIDVKAGDVIDLTTDVYGFDAKLFRVVTVREVDTDEGSIDIEITALEYDESVYDTSNLARYTRTTSTGITAIGAITAPDQPTVTTFSNVARPRIDCVTQINSGLADAVEFWITYDVPPGVTLDENRTYTLLGTVSPENSTTFSSGEEVTLSIDSLSTSNFLIKARAKNSNAVSPFGDPSGQVYYAPVQTTNSVSSDTTITDVNGNLLTAVGVATLLSELSTYFDEDTGYNFPGSGGAGGGYTFLVLSLDRPTGSAVLPFARVVPSVRGLKSIETDQLAISQCVGPQYAWKYWPQFYNRKYMLYSSYNGRPAIFVNVSNYRDYYPDATDITVHLRAYDGNTIINNDNVRFFANVYEGVTIEDLIYDPMSGTAQTNLNGSFNANVANYISRGDSISANAIVTSGNVYGVVNGVSDTTFVTNLNYKFGGEANLRPSWTYVNHSVSDVLSIPTDWQFVHTFNETANANVIVDMVPGGNITINAVPNPFFTRWVPYGANILYNYVDGSTITAFYTSYIQTSNINIANQFGPITSTHKPIEHFFRSNTYPNVSISSGTVQSPYADGDPGYGVTVYDTGNSNLVENSWAYFEPTANVVTYLTPTANGIGTYGANASGDVSGIFPYIRTWVDYRSF